MLWRVAASKLGEKTHRPLLPMQQDWRRKDLMGEALGPALGYVILEADMDDHAEGQEFAKTRAVSRLDWPTPEMLAAARRARGLHLRDLAVMLLRRVKALVADQLLVARPAKVPIGHRR